MRLMFIRKGHSSDSHTVKFFTRLFTMSQDFMKLCYVIDTDAVHFIKSHLLRLTDLFISTLVTRV